MAIMTHLLLQKPHSKVSVKDAAKNLTRGLQQAI